MTVAGKTDTTVWPPAAVRVFDSGIGSSPFSTRCSVVRRLVMHCRKAHGPVTQSSAAQVVLGSMPLARWVSATIAAASAITRGRNRSSSATFSANGSATHSAACAFRSATVASSPG